MLKNILILPDGRELSSGSAGLGIQTLTLTQSVNAGEELSLGSVCADMLEATIYDGGALHLQQGEEITLYKVDDQGNRTRMGIFLLEKVSRSGQNTYKILAYDRVIKLDRDITQWINTLSGWPYRLQDLAEMTAKVCGLELSATLPDCTVEKFTPRSLTARKLFTWAAQIAGCFCKANGSGVLEFRWYAPAPEGDLTVFRCTGEDYTVAPIENVRIALTDLDVGVCYPDTGENTYSVVGNYLLAGKSTEDMLPIAQRLYDRLQGVTYTPGTIKALTELFLQPGHIARIGDKTLYIMTKTQTGQTETLTSTGSANRNCATVQNNTTLQSLSGQVLEVKAELEGLQVENRKGESEFARLGLQVEGITAEVSRQHTQAQTLESQLTQLSQSAEALSVSVKQLAQQGVSRVENAFGLTIDGSAVRIHRSGSEMVNRLDETGMLVSRLDTPMLRADAQGVLATDVSVRNYLMIGDHARFEDYEADRTACYYL